MKTKRITHYDRILKHLKEKGSVTSLQAFRDYGVTRLSAVIYELRQDGYNITSTMTARKNRYGDKVYFAKYELHEIHCEEV